METTCGTVTPAARPAVHAGEAAAAVVDAPADHFERQRRAAVDVQAEHRRVEVGPDGVDVVQHQVLQRRALLQQPREPAVAQ